MKNGIAASPGYAIGQAHLKKDEDIEINKQKINDPEKELNRLDQALELAKKELEDIKERAIQQLGKEKAKIFEAHLMFLEDPELIPAIENKIKNESINAEAAVDEIVENYAQIFASMDNAYMQNREADVRDVGKRISRALQGKDQIKFDINQKAIIIASNLSPSDTAQLNTDIVKAFVTAKGNKTSHSAIMARSLGIPAVVGIGSQLIKEISPGDKIIVDGNEGKVFIHPDKDLLNKYSKKLKKYKESQKHLNIFIDKKATTKDGQKVKVAGNIGNLKDVKAVINNGGQGIGLFRTEFLYMDRNEIPDENEQLQVYNEVSEQMGDKPIVIRTLDIGGDKELPYLEQSQEINPFLGYRAIRLCLDQPDIFKPQLKAILRASKNRNIKIMYPMISSILEIKKANEILDDCKKELAQEKKEFGEPEIGIMIEIPSAVMMSDVLAREVDFFSIGTNDLIQYTTAVDRSNEKIAEMYTPYHPGILRLIQKTIESGHKEGIWVGMCGEAAGDELLLPFLLGAELDEFSMSAVSILKIKKLLSKWKVNEAREVTEKVLQLEDSIQIKQYLQEISR